MAVSNIDIMREEVSALYPHIMKHGEDKTGKSKKITYQMIFYLHEPFPRIPLPRILK